MIIIRNYDAEKLSARCAINYENIKPGVSSKTPGHGLL